MADQDPSLEADNPEEEGRPEWLPENFKSPEDLATSYRESQRKITELSQQNKGLEESIRTLSSQFDEFTAQQNQPDPGQVYAQWQEAFDQDPISTVQQIAAATAQQIAQQQAQQQGQVAPEVVAFMADQNLSAKYGDDWSSYKEKVGEVVKTDPLFQSEQLWSNPNLATQALERAYKLVKADDVLSGNTLAEQQAADTRQMKLNAQSAVGAAGRPEAPAADAEEWQRIKAAAPKHYWS